MGTFEDHIDDIKNGWIIASCVECIYGTSKAGQRFAILITKGVWYALRLIMDEEYRQYPRPWSWSLHAGPDWIIFTEHLTKDGALQKARLHKQQLEQGLFADVYKLLSGVPALPRTRVMPSDCAKNPDKYLRPGDLVQTNFLIAANHEGIYIGNGQVIHVSGHGEGKDGSVARVGRLLGDFVSKPDDTIRVVVYRIRFQTPENIVKQAKDYAEGKFRHGEYNLLIKNCQHFATLCIIGFEECGDKRKMLDILGNAGVAGVFILLALL